MSPRFHLLFLVLIEGRRRWGEFKISFRDPRDGKILLRSSTDWAVKEWRVFWEWGMGVLLDRECEKFLTACYIWENFMNS